MLSGEGNEKGEKKNRSNQQKRNFALSAHFLSRFLCRCFARLQRNFLVTCFIEEMSYVFVFTFFFTAAHFHPNGRQHFSFSDRRYKIFMLFYQQKNVSFGFFYLSLQLSVALYLVELRWPVAYFLFFSVFLYIPNLWT